MLTPADLTWRLAGRSRPAGPSVGLLVALALLLLEPGCDRCRDGAPGFLLEIRCPPILAGERVETLRLELEAASQAVSKSLAAGTLLDDGRTSVAVLVGEPGRGGFTAGVTVTALALDGSPLAVASETFPGAGDACNRFTLSLAGSDSDGGPGDGSPVDRPLGDRGGRDFRPERGEICDNTVDDDGNGLADCVDPICFSAASCCGTSYCVIGPRCWKPNAINPANKCQRCQPAASDTGWTFFGNTGCVTTLAGSGIPGYLDGPALQAQLTAAGGLAVDPSGKVFFTDGNRVRLVAAGQVSTIAGAAAAGFVDGVPADARFNMPQGLVLDATGNLYVSDGLNHRIRVVLPGQYVYTIAGSGVAGFADGIWSTAQFNFPEDISFLSGGQLVVADNNNCRVRLLSKVSSPTVSTLAGIGCGAFADGPVSTARVGSLHGLAASGSKVYVADGATYRVRLIENGQVTTFAGTGVSGYKDGPAAQAQFGHVDDVAVDAAGKVYVAEAGDRRIRVIAAGVVSTLAGDGTAGYLDGPALSARFNYPSQIAVDSQGTIHVGDGPRIRVIHP